MTNIDTPPYILTSEMWVETTPSLDSGLCKKLREKLMKEFFFESEKVDFKHFKDLLAAEITKTMALLGPQYKLGCPS